MGTIRLPILATRQALWDSDVMVRVAINDLAVWTVVDRAFFVSAEGLEVAVVARDPHHITVRIPGDVFDGRRIYTLAIASPAD